MAFNLHIGEIANLTLSLIGIFLNLKNRKKTVTLLRVKVPRFSSLWLCVLFAGIVSIAVIVFQKNEILALMACTLLYFVIENKIYDRENNWITDFFNGTIHTIKVWPILFIVGWLSSLLLEGYEAQDNVLRLQNGNYGNIGTIIITACIIAPITEELIFRGMMYPLFKKSIGVLWGCVISSLIFSFIHYNILTFSVLFVFSCCLTYIYERSNSIIVPIVSHSIFNGIMIILILLK